MSNQSQVRQLLKNYLRSFYLYYAGCYIVGMAISMMIDSFGHGHFGGDLLVIAMSCGALPLTISQKFKEKEGRLFNDEERKIMIKKSIKFAWIISSILPTILFGYPLLIKLFLSPIEIQQLIQQTSHHAGNATMGLLNFPLGGLMFTFFGSFIFYYLLIRFAINRGYKRADKKLAGNLLNATNNIAS